MLLLLYLNPLLITTIST